MLPVTPPTDKEGNAFQVRQRTKYLPNDEWMFQSFLTVERHLLFYGEL